VADITKDSTRTAFATYARDHEAASIRRRWPTWNVLCTFLYTGELLTANPMQVVGRPKLANRSQGPPPHRGRSTAGSRRTWPVIETPLFVSRDGERITRGALQSRIKRVFKRAGPDAQPVPVAV
jgi:site-specific recombinase XerC